MEVRKDSNERLSVPAFGEWDGKVGLPDYSIDFSRIREHRRQNKSRVSLGNEDEFLNRTGINGDQNVESLKKNLPLHQQHGNATVMLLPHALNHRRRSRIKERKKRSRYFNCCGCLGA